MDDPKSDSVLETKIIETWTTLDYRADKWGPERIVFEVASNHGDSGGTFSTYFLQDNAYVDFREYDPKKKAEEVVFSDDGGGYSYIYTVLQYSNKKDRDSQTGKFGEGLKMGSAAGLRHDVDQEFGSQNWSARPLAKKIYLEQEDKEVEILCQEITIGHEPIKGSYTRIRNPSPEIIKQVLSFSERIIDYREDLVSSKRIGLYNKHQLFLPATLFQGELFIKKIKYYLDKPLFLTYQVNGLEADSLLSPDRDHVIESELDQILKRILLQLNSEQLIKPLLLPNAPDCVEREISFFSADKPKYPQAWYKAFHQIYGQKAVLAERRKININADAQGQGFKIIKDIPSGLQNVLLSAGVKSAAEVLNYKPEYEYVPLDELTPAQRKVYDLRVEADKIIFNGPLPAEVLIFSHAYDQQGRVTWFEAMSYWDASGKEPSQINIPLESLNDRERYLASYSHEAVHVSTRAADLSTEFENGLTIALGKALSAAIKKQ